MLNVIDKMYISLKARWNVFKNQEHGDVNIVSIIVICGIVILVAAVFRTQLETFVKTLFGNLTTNAQKTVDGP